METLYFRTKDAILVAYTTLSSVSSNEYKPEQSGRWAEAIQAGVLAIGFISVEAIQDVLELAMTCTSEEAQTYQFMQIGDNQLHDILVKHGCI